MSNLEIIQGILAEKDVLNSLEIYKDEINSLPSKRIRETSRDLISLFFEFFGRKTGVKTQLLWNIFYFYSDKFM